MIGGSIFDERRMTETEIYTIFEDFRMSDSIRPVKDLREEEASLS